MTNHAEDSIVRTVEIDAPVSRVWRALTDYRQFGEWFRVRIDGPFKVGEISRGKILVPGFEHVPWESVIEKIEPERVFAYSWHPYAVEPGRDYSSEKRTYIEFVLEPRGDGARLTVTESGFMNIPDARRLEAFRANTQGWEAQLKNIKANAEA